MKYSYLVFCREKSINSEEKFIVSKSKLLELFEHCSKCLRLSSAEIKYVIGSMVCIQSVCCACGNTEMWQSQPYIRNVPEVNLLFTGAVLASGMSYIKTIRLFQHLDIAIISESTFKIHSKGYVQPVIYQMWQEQQQHLFTTLQRLGGELVLAGDSRCDSPGHCAKFGTYVFLEMQINKVIDIQVIQVSSWMSTNKHKSSYWCVYCFQVTLF